ncbi:unnamed protein product [marine sediment metagenome]|uniref:Uncharacterized protein n=1 Tax=marine sediment metagenome TaxID=412755 RepID=X0SHC0_9ZZZZ
MHAFRIAYTKYTFTYTRGRHSGEHVKRYTKRRSLKKMISSAANILYRINASKAMELRGLQIQTNTGEWIDYDLGDIVPDAPRAVIVERLEDISEFHSVFYKGVP